MNNSGNIRNFVIISHIDHGKSTLADRFLEITKTVDARQMKAQFLDSLESERERGITIKMAPVRMVYGDYILNMIDTPGHSDFSYEVSRALVAVEGAILLVDITQGIQAQTLAKFYSAKKAGLKIIGAVNKVDLISDEGQLNRRVKDLADLIGCEPKEIHPTHKQVMCGIHKISGKTGQGIEELLKAIIKEIPNPKKLSGNENLARALIFDLFYDDHKGIIASVRVFGGEFNVNEEAYLIAADEKFKMKEVGYFLPQLKPIGKLSAGEIGYIATGLKNPDRIKIGDTIITNHKSQITNHKSLALSGYDEPKPVVFVSFYPENSNQYDDLKKAFGRLKLNDSSLKFEADFNEVLGRGFKVGFLGKLHFEITAERLEKEFDIKTINSFPSVAYKVNNLIIDNPADLPDDIKEILEPMINLEIISPGGHLGDILQLKEIFRMENITTNNLGAEGIILITAKMPLAELISDFDDRLKSVSEGFASFNYELANYQKAELEKMEILIANAPVAGLVRIVPKKRLEYEARKMVEKLKDVLPRQQFTQAIQAVAGGRIIARETISAMKKDVAGYLYGGDRSRKMKLWKKQKKGKKKLLSRSLGTQVRIPAEVFKKIIQ
ncbi:elongation factor 4 [Candidatus Wolfebacteria bacterium CG_4_10_14_0_8_um_filter_37_11]|uniref:Elongation factor 4 n=1 Tax=Candidatus Wolfebacteria bacterium CG_4_10_14_0_8_um_filter_37_11 TaxID=1975062 RepID=A0A2M7Q883_9BACT|nr:MAG: elongation factor 4 [Candidatus Wolfebacteria bacterium CG_4_10_14_0_8_um_filter_37_11]